MIHSDLVIQVNPIEYHNLMVGTSEMKLVTFFNKTHVPDRASWPSKLAGIYDFRRWGCRPDITCEEEEEQKIWMAF